MSHLLEVKELTTAFAAKKSRRNSPWRVCDSLRQDRMGAGAYPCDRIQSETGFQSGIYGKRYRSLCQSSVPAVPGRAEGMQNGV